MQNDSRWNVSNTSKLLLWLVEHLAILNMNYYCVNHSVIFSFVCGTHSTAHHIYWKHKSHTHIRNSVASLCSYVVTILSDKKLFEMSLVAIAPRIFDKFSLLNAIFKVKAIGCGFNIWLNLFFFSEMWILLVLHAFITIWFFWTKWRQSYWSRKGLLHPTPDIFFGNIGTTLNFTEHISTLTDRWYKWAKVYFVWFFHINGS